MMLRDTIARLEDEAREYEFWGMESQCHIIHTLVQIFCESFGTENYETQRDTGFRENFAAIFEDLEDVYQDGFTYNLKDLLSFPQCQVHPFFQIHSFITLSVKHERSPTFEEYLAEIEKCQDEKSAYKYAMSFLQVDEETCKRIFEKFEREYSDFNIFQWGIYASEMFDWMDCMKIEDI